MCKSRKYLYNTQYNNENYIQKETIFNNQKDAHSSQLFNVEYYYIQVMYTYSEKGRKEKYYPFYSINFLFFCFGVRPLECI